MCENKIYTNHENTVYRKKYTKYNKKNDKISKQLYNNSYDNSYDKNFCVMTGGNILLENNLFCNLIQELEIYKKCTYLYVDKHMIRSISSTNDNIKNKK